MKNLLTQAGLLMGRSRRRVSAGGFWTACVFSLALLSGGCGAASDSVGQEATAQDGQSAGSTTVETTASSTAPTTASTTAQPSVASSSSDAPDSTSNANPLGGNSPEDFLMPDVICMNLQEAQDEIQDHGVFLSKSEDATGEDRMQMNDSNWVVVDQTPAPGTPIEEGEAVLQVVKYDDPHPC